MEQWFVIARTNCFLHTIFGIFSQYSLPQSRTADWQRLAAFFIYDSNSRGPEHSLYCFSQDIQHWHSCGTSKKYFVANCTWDAIQGVRLSKGSVTPLIRIARKMGAIKNLVAPSVADLCTDNLSFFTVASKSLRSTWNAASQQKTSCCCTQINLAVVEGL